MKVKIRSKASASAKGGVGSLAISVEKHYYKVSAVVFSREQASILKVSADKACQRNIRKSI